MEFRSKVWIAAGFAALGIFSRSWKSACICLLAGMIGLLLADFFFGRKRAKQIEELTLYLMKVQDDLQLPELSGQQEGAFGILQSEIYKLVALLQVQSQRAQSERTYLAQMLSDISHQIKTPLAAVTLMTDLLKDPQISAEKRLEFTENIDMQTEKITWLIRNILTLSQLEAQMLKLKRETVSVKTLLEQGCQTFAVLAEMKDITLDIAVQTDFEMICDAAWTTEALSNIVKNCLEHTQNGGRVRIAAVQNNFSTAITISDNGSGIAKEDLPHIFERFYKGRHASKSSVGIGLAMAKQIVMEQNGVINVESEEGKGTTFTMKFYK